MTPEIRRLTALYNQADKTLLKKMGAARRDIHETQILMVQSYLPAGMPNTFKRHIDIMREYIHELDQRRDEIFEEYCAEIDKLEGVFK